MQKHHNGYKNRYKKYYKLPFVFFLVLLVGLLLIFRTGIGGTNAETQIVCPVNGQFNVVGPVICDPDGQPFLPRGINVFAGYTFGGFVTSLLPDDSVSKLVDGWKFNTLRVVTCPDTHCASHEQYGGQTVQGDDLDAVITKYTARKVVVILDYHSPLLGSPSGPTAAQRQFSLTWFKEQANKYKTNPYVWFEPFNEPLEEGAGISGDWLNFTKLVVEGVRSTGSKNVLLLNTNHYGQDRWSVGGAINSAESAILTHGPSLSTGFGNIVFDMHLYSRWWQTSAADMSAYFKKVQDANLAIMIGETWGDAAGSQEFMRQDQTATDTLYTAKPKGVGITPWSAAGNYPATNGGGALAINSLTNPTNLSHNGQLHWNWTHAPPSAVPDGFTVVTSASPSPSTAITPTTPAGCAKKTTGDADCNGSVAIADFALWRAEFLGGCSSTTLNAAACGGDADSDGSLIDADFNNDGKVTIADFAIWRTFFLAALTTPTTNPSGGPSTAPCNSQEDTSCAQGNLSGTFFRETFTASPAGPQSVMNRPDLLPRWFAQPVMQGTYGWDFAPEPMHAQHSAECGAPPAAHMISTYQESVYQCKDHIMTAINPPSAGTASGIVTMTPNHMVDLSTGEAIIRVDVSTKSPTTGDWWEIWITPWDDQLIAPTDHWLHHAGSPREAIQLQVRDFSDGSKRWAHQTYKNYAMQIPEFVGDGTLAFWKGKDFRALVPVSDTRRDLYEVRVSKSHVKLFVKSPVINNELRLVDEFDIPGGFNADAAVVQFLESNYEPELGGKIGCSGDPCPVVGEPATWHWDSIEISPAIPYKLIGVNEYQIWSGSTSKNLTFREAAPANARMLFSGWTKGNDPEISFDNGASWQIATAVRPPNDPQGAGFNGDPDLLTYSIPVPQGKTSAQVRGVSECPSCGIPQRTWAMQNFYIIAR